MEEESSGRTGGNGVKKQQPHAVASKKAEKDRSFEAKKRTNRE